MVQSLGRLGGGPRPRPTCQAQVPPPEPGPPPARRAPRAPEERLKALRKSHDEAQGRARALGALRPLARRSVLCTLGGASAFSLFWGEDRILGVGLGLVQLKEAADLDDRPEQARLVGSVSADIGRALLACWAVPRAMFLLHRDLQEDVHRATRGPSRRAFMLARRMEQQRVRMAFYEKRVIEAALEANLAAAATMAAEDGPKGPSGPEGR